MIHIKKQTLTLNKQSDTELLPDAYLSILEYLSPTWSVFPTTNGIDDM